MAEVTVDTAAGLERALQGGERDHNRFKLFIRIGQEGTDYAGLAAVLKKYKFWNLFRVIALTGPTELDGTNVGTIHETNQEAEDFFKVLGQLETLQVLEIYNLDLPVQLLTHLFKQIPQSLWVIRLQNTKLLNGNDDTLSSVVVCDFITAIKKLPKFRVFENHRSLNKEFDLELVKLNLPNIIVGINVPVECPFQTDVWTTFRANRPFSGAYVAVRNIDLATAALVGNDNLERLWFTLHPQDANKKQMSSFFKALGGNKSLNILNINLDHISSQADFLGQLARVIPELSVRRLVIYGSRLAFEHVEQDFTIALSKNYCLQELHRIPENGPLAALYSNAHGFYLRLNHHGQFPRKDIMHNPQSVTPEKWAKTFAAFAARNDVGALSYYFGIYAMYNSTHPLSKPSEEQGNSNTPLDSTFASHSGTRPTLETSTAAAGIPICHQDSTIAKHSSHHHGKKRVYNHHHRYNQNTSGYAHANRANYQRNGPNERHNHTRASPNGGGGQYQPNRRGRRRRNYHRQRRQTNSNERPTFLGGVHRGGGHQMRTLDHSGGPGYENDNIYSNRGNP